MKIDFKKISKFLPKNGIVKMLSPILEIGVLSVSRGLMGGPKVKFNAYAIESDYKNFTGNPINFVDTFMDEIMEKAPEMFTIILGAIPDNEDGLQKTEYLKRSLANLISEGVKSGLRYCYLDTINNKCFFQYMENKKLTTRELKLEDLINIYLNG